MNILLVVLFLPLLALAQSSSSNSASSKPSASATSSPPASTAFTTILSTSVTSFVTIVANGGNRVESIVVSTQVFSSVQAIVTGNATTNGTSSANSTTSSTSSTSSSPLPTAPTNINGGGQGGAPFPGASGVNGAYGPDDGYIAAASTLTIKGLAASLMCCLICGFLLVL